MREALLEVQDEDARYQGTFNGVLASSSSGRRLQGEAAANSLFRTKDAKSQHGERLVMARGVDEQAEPKRSNPRST